jgi:ABC-type transport system involved in cytochrome c biogenesis ATPase subunit
VAQREASNPTEDTSANYLGRLVSYSVRDLFGRRDITFDLAVNGPTLLTGANGSGKSTVLRTIEAISAGNWASLLGIPFSTLTLSFSSGKQITVTQNDDGLQVSRTGHETLPWPRRQYMTDLYTTYEPPQFGGLTTGGLVKIPYMPTTTVQFSPSFTVGPLGLSTGAKVPTPWTSEIYKDFPVLYVSDDRLVTGSETADQTEGPPGSLPIRASGVVDQVAADIAQVIESSLAQYAQRAQAIDRDFPGRVISALEQRESENNQQIDDLLTEVDARRNALESVGMLPENETPLANLNLAAPNARAVIRVFAEDILRKLDTLEPIRSRLKLFTDFLNRHYRGKEVLINSKYGAIIADTETPQPQVIPASRLSSGEQHILVLAHRVLFQAGEGTLVLIDEPELSLHVLWQDTFVDDMDLMGKESGLSFLFATHSPTLVAGRDDLRRPLDLL